MNSDVFSKIPRLLSPRLILRNFEKKDIIEYIYEFKNENVQKYLGGVQILANEEKHINNWLQNINEKLLMRKLVFTWHITKRENTNISVGRIDLGGFQNKKVAEIAYYLWEKHWGNGYAKEAIDTVVNFGFEKLELLRIQAIIDNDNIRSKNVIEKAGFKKEGILRNYPIGKSISDASMYSIIN